MSVRKREQVDQQRANFLKTIRAAIRLRHSINADNEINEVLPEAQKQFDAAALGRKQLPEPIDIMRALKL